MPQGNFLGRMFPFLQPNAGGAAFGTLMPQEQAEVPPNAVDKTVQGMGSAALDAFMTPGRVMQSQEPMSTEDMVSPALNMASVMQLGSGALTAEPNSLRMGATIRRLGEKASPEDIAESIWQTNKGKLKSALEELDRMRGFPERFGSLESIDAIEGHVRDKATRPFFDAAKMDRMREWAFEKKEGAGSLSMDDLRTKYPKASPSLLEEVFKSFQ